MKLFQIPPSTGNLLYIFLNVAVPPLALILILADLSYLAYALVLLSKWRILAAKASFWLPNIRANLVDIIVAIASVRLIDYAVAEARASESVAFFIWVSLFTLLLLFWTNILKPKSDKSSIQIQAHYASLIGFWAIAVSAFQLPSLITLILGWIVGTSVARHVLTAYDDEFKDSLSVVWGFLMAQLVFISSHWVSVYQLGEWVQLPQLALLSGVLFYMATEIYKIHSGEESSRNIRQLLYFGGAVIILIFVFSDWTGNN